MSEKVKWLTVGTIRKNDGGKLYIKVDQAVTLPAGTVLMLQKPEEAIKRLQSMGFLDEEKAAARLATIPEYIKYNVVLPPPKTK